MPAGARPTPGMARMESTQSVDPAKFQIEEETLINSGRALAP